jgi:hypothetical protein
MTTLEQEFVEFRTLSNVTPTYSTTGFTGRNGKANYVVIDERDGEVIKKRFQFEDGVLRIHRDNQDEISFMRNHVHCDGSSNAGGQVMFREYDRFKEQRAAHDTAMRMAEAIGIAARLTGATKQRVALMLGLNPNADTPTLVTFAQQNPEAVISQYENINQPEVRTRAIIRKGKSMGVIKVTEGGFLSWNHITLGSNENAAVEYLHKIDHATIRDELSRAVELADMLDEEPPKVVKGKSGGKVAAAELSFMPED